MVKRIVYRIDDLLKGVEEGVEHTCPECGSHLEHHKSRYECPNAECGVVEVRINQNGIIYRVKMASV